MHWFTLSWWKYLFEKKRGYYSGVGGIKRAVCRARNHPAGVWYYNFNGLKPDMHCKNCGYNLG